MRSKSSKPRTWDIASLLLLLLNAIGMVVVGELLSVDEIVRYHSDGAITSSQFRMQAMLLLAVVAANGAACLVSIICAFSDRPDRPEDTNV